VCVHVCVCVCMCVCVYVRECLCACLIENYNREGSLCIFRDLGEAGVHFLLRLVWFVRRVCTADAQMKIGTSHNAYVCGGMGASLHTAECCTCC